MLKLRRNYLATSRSYPISDFHSQVQPKNARADGTIWILKICHPQLFLPGWLCQPEMRCFLRALWKCDYYNENSWNSAWQPWRLVSPEPCSSGITTVEAIISFDKALNSKPIDPGICGITEAFLKELRRYEAALASFTTVPFSRKRYKSLAQPGLTLKWNFTKTRSLRLTKALQLKPIIMRLGLIEVLCWGFCSARGSFHFADRAVQPDDLLG